MGDGITVDAHQANRDLAKVSLAMVQHLWHAMRRLSQPKLAPRPTRSGRPRDEILPPKTSYAGDTQLATTMIPSGDEESFEDTFIPIDRQVFSSTSPARFCDRGIITRGGMGEIIRVFDRGLNRIVAVKHVISDRNTPAYEERLLREARLQGGLAHPGVVPVYDLGINTEGRPFFIMPEIQGETLERVLQQRHSSIRRLLEIMGRLALTLEYVHQRGVIHGDVTPSNVMIGHYGEVYLLDWGTARQMPKHSDSCPPGPVNAHESAIVGTPAYMAPEQVRSELLDGRADVYALGAILFEILTNQPLRYQRNTIEMLAFSQLDPCVRERLSGLQIPVELVNLCDAATAVELKDRIPSARKFYDELTAYLDNHRTRAERRTLAEQLTTSALEMLDEDPNARNLALKQLARAIALDPEYQEAASALTSTLLERQGTVPPSATEQIAQDDKRAGKRSAQLAIAAHLAWMVLFPPAYYSGLRDPVVLITLLSPALVTILLNAIALRRGWSRPLLFLVAITSYFNVAALSLVAGPLVIVPTAVVGTTAAFLVLLSDDALLRTVLLGISVSAVLLPTLGELIGLLPPSYAFVDGAVVLLPRYMQFHSTLFYAMVLISSLLVIVSNHFTLAAMVIQHRKTKLDALVMAHKIHEVVPVALSRDSIVFDPCASRADIADRRSHPSRPAQS